LGARHDDEQNERQAEPVSRHVTWRVAGDGRRQRKGVPSSVNVGALNVPT
jgi:hypothetical protein